MAAFCTECGNPVDNTTVFCTHCGTKISSPTPPQPVSPSLPQQEEIPPAAQQPIPSVVPVSPPQTAAPVQPIPSSENKVVGTGVFFWLMLLFALPVAGLIACLIMAFAPKNKNLKHFSRAVLIWMIVGMVCTGLLVGSLYLFADNIWDSVTNTLGGSYSSQQEEWDADNSYSSQYGTNSPEDDQSQEEVREDLGVFGDLFEGLGDLSDAMNDMEGLSALPNE